LESLEGPDFLYFFSMYFLLVKTTVSDDTISSLRAYDTVLSFMDLGQRIVGRATPPIFQTIVLIYKESIQILDVLTIWIQYDEESLRRLKCFIAAVNIFFYVWSILPVHRILVNTTSQESDSYMLNLPFSRYLLA